MKYIYALIDPRTRQIRYIGQTDGLSKRLQQHIMDKSNTPKTEWIKGLLAANMRPDIIQLAEIEDEDNVHMIEYRWVYFGRKNGWELTNTVGMKSEDYYSLQGYFERLIVEMEKPQDVVSAKHTMADVRQELVNVLFYLVQWAYRVKILSLPALVFVFAYIASLAWCILQITLTRDPNSGVAVIGIIGSFVIGLSTLLLPIGFIDPKKNDSTLVLKKVLCVVSVAEFLLGFIVFFAR